jgi:hypothetical protein
MKSTTKILSAVLGLLMVMTLASAQVKYGSIIGTISDKEGEALPGCTVSIVSSSLIEHSVSYITNAKGLYRFINLPPGLYTLTVELQGFKKSEQKDIRVGVGETVTLNVVMEQGVIDQVVTVTATTPTVDIKSSDLSVDYTAEMLQSLPIRVHNLNIINLAPGVYNSAAQGSTLYSNQYQLDGQNVNDQWYGSLKAEVPYDLIEETEVTTAGGTAEFGEYTGAVVNAVTKSGSNNFSGQFNFYFYNNDMVSHGENAVTEPATHYDGSLFLGGPIKENRLWFFLGGAYLRDVTKSPDITDGKDGITARPFFYVKSNYLLNARNKGFVSYQYDRKRVDVGSDIYTAESALYHTIYYEHLLNIQHQIIFNSNTFLAAKFNYKTWEGEQIPNNPTESGHYDLLTNYSSGGMGAPNGDDTWRARFTLDLTHFKDSWLFGSHEMKAGFVYDRSEGTNYYGYTNNTYYLDYDGAPYLVFTADHREISPQGQQDYDAYVQDSITLGTRLTLDLGLRWSYSSARVLDATTSDGTRVSGRGEMFEWSNLAPRVAFSYALTKDLKTLFKASYGRYYNANTWYTFYGYSPYSMTKSLWYVEDGSWELLSVSGPSTNQDINPNLKRPYVDTVLVGIEREILKDFTLEISYVYKAFRNLQGDVNTLGEYVETTAVDPVTGEAVTVYNQTNAGDNYYYRTTVDDLNYHYSGFDFVLNKRFSKNWFFQASLHLEKTAGLANGDRFGGNVYKDPNNAINAYGKLDNSREYQFKLLGSYIFPRLGVRMAAIYSFAQGPRYSRKFTADLDQGPVEVFAVPRSSLVGDSIQGLDIRLEKTFTIGKMGLGVVADIHNAFNADKPISYYDLLDTGSLQVSAYQDPRYYQLGMRLTF